MRMILTNENDIDDLLLPDPYILKPWEFPNPGVVYKGTIFTTPKVNYRVNGNGNPLWTSERARRWSLRMGVKTDDGNRAFWIENNSIARAFNGRATEKNLRRWADQWKIGDCLQISWTRDSQGERLYRGRHVR